MTVGEKERPYTACDGAVCVSVHISCIDVEHNPHLEFGHHS